MDLILDDGGTFVWSRGPTTAPVLSHAARRLTLHELSPVHGCSSQNSEAEEVDPSPFGGLSGLFSPLAAGVPAWSIDPAVWATTQFSTAQLGDRRRTARLVALAQQIARDPISGLPRQTEKWGDSKAAYRLLNRPEATFEVIATPHWQRTRSQAEPGPSLGLG